MDLGSVSESRGCNQRKIRGRAVAGLLTAAWLALPGLAAAQTPTGLDSPDAGTRVQGVFAVRTSGDVTALPKLGQLVQVDEHKGVRLFSAMALGELAGPEYYPILQSVVDLDPAPEVRQAATQAMDQIAQRTGVAVTPPTPPAPPAPPPAPVAVAPVVPAAPVAVASMPATDLPPPATDLPPPATDLPPPIPYSPPAESLPPPAASYPPATALAPPAALFDPLAPPADPGSYGLPGAAPAYGHQGGSEVSGLVGLRHDSIDDTVTAAGKDLVSTTAVTQLGLDLFGGYFLIDGVQLLGNLGVELTKTSLTAERIQPDLTIATDDSSLATNEFSLAVGAGYVHPLTDELFGQVGLLGGAYYRIAQLADRDEMGIGYQVRGLLGLRYALASRVHLVGTVDGTWKSRRLTVSPLDLTRSEYDQDQATFGIGLDLGLSVWF